MNPRINALRVKIEIQTGSGENILTKNATYLAQTLTTPQMDELCKKIDRAVNEFLLKEKI